MVVGWREGWEGGFSSVSSGLCNVEQYIEALEGYFTATGHWYSISNSQRSLYLERPGHACLHYQWQRSCLYGLSFFLKLFWISAAFHSTSLWAGVARVSLKPEKSKKFHKSTTKLTMAVDTYKNSATTSKSLIGLARTMTSLSPIRFSS